MRLAPPVARRGSRLPEVNRAGFCQPPRRAPFKHHLYRNRKSNIYCFIVRDIHAALHFPRTRLDYDEDQSYGWTLVDIRNSVVQCLIHFLHCGYPIRGLMCHNNIIQNEKNEKNEKIKNKNKKTVSITVLWREKAYTGNIKVDLWF